jgi:hydroxymethylpyrimidine/phosphomethylpyrimidine kinase
MKRPPVVLTIAGSDSGGGAGIQGDLKTFSALGCYGVSVITALTAQNSVGVQSVHSVPPAFVTEQLESVNGDLRPDAAKTGMLATAGIIRAVAAGLASFPAGMLVVDPVMVSTTGHSLIDSTAVDALVTELFPLAEVITPNLFEASALLGRKIARVSQMEQAAGELHALGAKTVLLKGGHLADSATDYFFDGEEGEFLKTERIDTPHTHGSGCVLAAAVAAYLGGGYATAAAVRKAKTFITEAVRNAYQVGRGPGPVNPMAKRCTGRD